MSRAGTPRRGRRCHSDTHQTCTDHETNILGFRGNAVASSLRTSRADHRRKCAYRRKFRGRCKSGYRDKPEPSNRLTTIRGGSGSFHRHSLLFQNIRPAYPYTAAGCSPCPSNHRGRGIRRRFRRTGRDRNRCCPAIRDTNSNNSKDWKVPAWSAHRSADGSVEDSPYGSRER